MPETFSSGEIDRGAAYLDVILQAIEDGITVQEPNGALVYANAAAARLIGYDSVEELLSAPVAEVITRFTVYDEGMRAVPAEDLPNRKALLGAHPPETVLGFRDRRGGEPRWSLVKSAPVLDDRGEVRLAVTVFSDVTERKRSADERDELLAREQNAREDAENLQRFFEFLAEAGQVLASSLDYETTLRSVAALAVPHIADWCAIHVVEEDGSVQQLAVAHVDPSKTQLALELNEKYPFDPDAPGGAPYVLRTGEAELISEIPEALLLERIPDEELLAIIRGLGFRSSMVVPLTARDEVLGAITMVSAESGRHFMTQDLALARELATRAALAVDNARLHRRSERAAAERAAILEHMADGVVMLDREGTIRYLNRVGRELLGFDEREHGIEDVTIAGRGNLDQRPLTVEETALGRALRGETVLNVERWVRHADGSEVALRASTTPIFGEDGTMLGAVGVFSDITTERRLEQEKDAFLAAAAHDLKTPLATIKGLAQVLERRLQRADVPETARFARSLGQIDDAVVRMTRLINDLLDVSRIQMGRPLDLNAAQADLIPLLHSLIEETQQTTARHRIIFHAEVEALVGSWDVDRLARVFSNLLANAVKYTPQGGDIVMTVTRDDSGVAVVSVRDQGVGIPAGERDRIFDRFYRAQNVRARIAGTGIGLASARQIVEQHGGSITVESEEGEGSTFVVRLPLA